MKLRTAGAFGWQLPLAPASERSSLRNVASVFHASSRPLSCPFGVASQAYFPCGSLGSADFFVFTWFRFTATGLRLVFMYMLRHCGWSVLSPAWNRMARFAFLGRLGRPFGWPESSAVRSRMGENLQIQTTTLWVVSGSLRLYLLADVWQGVHGHKLRVTGRLQRLTCVRATTLCQMIHGARYCTVFVRAQLLWRLSKSPRADLHCKSWIIDWPCTTKQLHWQDWMPC